MERDRSLITALGDAGHRLTEPRRAVAALIAARDGHFSAADLVDDARSQRLGIGRATIFRTLDLFAELNVLERLDLPTGDHAYVACRPRHHHHVVCSGCGRTADVDDCVVAGLATEVQERTGFRVEGHRVEIFGLCEACQKRDGSGSGVTA
jgi:Fur family ferric uptake transcriptional regulator